MAKSKEGLADLSLQQTTAHDTDAAGDTNHQPVAETIAFQEVSPAAAADEKKQEMDLAFAAAVLASGKVSERQIVRILRTWTIHGSETLGNRLRTERLITEEDEKRFTADARRRLSRLGSVALTDSQVASDANRSSPNDSRNTRLNQLDPSGRLIKLLGLVVDVGSTDDQSRSLECRFSLIRKLGEGGLGVVWLARDENLNRYVAIKEIRAQTKAQSDAAIARFKREAEITGRLEHPGIVPIYQFGVDVKGQRYFYAMRFLGKHTMQDAILEYHERREAGNDEPLLLHRLLTSFVNLCQSVAHAHSKKIIHRDLKPENVALDGFGQVILLDWGLAKINDEFGIGDTLIGDFTGDASNSSLTLANQVLGSPMFMAPEQAAGRLDDIDEQTDVFGLGGILYGILTGHAPHENTIADTGSGTSMPDLLSSIVSRPIAPPSNLVPDVSPALEAICLKATNQKKYLRYDSASDIAEDVERYLAGDEVSAYEEPPTRRAIRWMSRHPRTSQIIGVAVAFLMAMIFIGGYSLRQRQIAENNLRFSHAADTAKELALLLESQAQLVTSDIRFVTGLPPIQGIIDSHKGVSTDGDNEETWIGRLETILDGLITNNDSYLGIAYLKVGDEVEQLCRAERNLQTGRVRRLPHDMLKPFPKDENGPDFESLRPGDVVLRSSDLITEAAPTKFRSALSIAGVGATFDQDTGELFGFAAAQIDLRKLIEDRVNSLGREHLNVYLTDRGGMIQLMFEAGEISTRDTNKAVNEVIPELEDFLEVSDEEIASDGHSYYAIRLTLGSTIAQSEAVVGVVAQVID